MLIGEVARSTGLTASAIRYYEKHGVLPRSARNSAGYRDFTDQDVDLLRFVRRLRALNFPLQDVRDIVSLRSDGVAPCRSLRAAIAREASLVDREMRRLAAVRDQLRSIQVAADRIEDNWPKHCVCSLVHPDNSDPDADPEVDVTLQYFEGCPNWELVDRRLRKLGVTATRQRIDTYAEAVRQGFRGSPTVLVNGADPFHDPDAQIGLSCRVYPAQAGLAGAPSSDDLKDAIEEARKKSSGTPATRAFR